MLQEAIFRDVEPYSDAKSRTRRYVRADIARMPFQDDAFDSVIAGAALHCWPVVQDALVEIRRVLKPGGKFFATTFARGTNVRNHALRDFLLPAGSVPASHFVWLEELVWLCKAAGFSQVDVTCDKSFIMVRCRK